MNEEQRARIIAYNREKAKYKEAYDDLIKLIKPLEKVLNLLPNAARKIIAKYIEER